MPPPEAIGGVGLDVGFVDLVRLHVNGTRHDQLVDRLELPAVLDQFLCEIIEQFRMRRRIALDADVVRRANTTIPHLLLPKPIANTPPDKNAGTMLRDAHPGRERD